MGHDLTAAADWTFPVPIAYGPGRLAEIGARAAALGLRNPLIVTDRGSRELPFIADCAKALGASGLGAGIFADVSPNPRDGEIAAGALHFREGGHDGVIAIGGGSGMDAGKAVALTATSGEALWDFEWERPPVALTRGFPALICIPTTAGTGAETACAAMITDTAAGMKLCVAHPGLKPALALLDPALTAGLPAKLTAWTGIDALVHGIEAYSVPHFHPLCDGAALEALRLIGAHLERAVGRPDDISARGGMLVGSCLAGIAFQKGLGLVHAISHMAGAEFDTHHGLTNAVVLPAVLRFNAPAIGDRIAPMAQALGLAQTGFDALDAHICALLDRLEIPRGLGEIGVDPARASALADKAMRDTAFGTNPRAASPAEMRALTEAVIGTAR